VFSAFIEGLEIIAKGKYFYSSFLAYIYHAHYFSKTNKKQKTVIKEKMNEKVKPAKN
jgi:hypothetical protein